MSIESVMPSNHLILCHPLPLLPSILPSIRVFSNESILCMRQPKYWSFSFSISPSNEYSGLIFFRIDWFGLLAVQGTLKSLLQHHSSKASTLWHSAFFIVHLSHPYLTTGKTIALTTRRQVRCSGIPISLRIFQFVVIHTVKSFGTVNEAEVDVFLEFSCFSYNSTDDGNFISGSSAFPIFSSYIRKFSVHILLKPSLKDFEHDLAGM